jgi:predicted transcriptional regulator
MVDTTDRAWLDRVRRTVERLRKEAERHPDEMYYQLCLKGWEAELRKIEGQEDKL